MTDTINLDGMSPVASPCIRLCELDANKQLCVGCWRHIDEIIAWSKVGELERRDILERVQARRRSLRVDEFTSSTFDGMEQNFLSK